MGILVGVGVLIFRDSKVLLGKRKGSHGSACWGLPGGHLEFGESVVDCAKRETREETGLIIEKMSHAGFSSDVFEDIEKHYVTLFVEADDPGGLPMVLEPEKCEYWQWFAWDDLPEPLFAPFSTLVNAGYLPGAVNK